jgi:predicted lipid-binding transport protein (Tim44 family)
VGLGRRYDRSVNPSPKRLGLVALLALTLLVLISAGVALADAGGGSSNYGGGGGGSGGGGGGSDFGGGGGDGNSGGSWLVILIVLAGFILVFGFSLLRSSRKGGRLAGRASDLAARPFSALRRRRRRERVRRVELAAAEAAEDDDRFAPQRVRTESEQLFRDVQSAWDKRDEARLGTLLEPDLLVEWRRRLADFDGKGWHSRAEVLGDVHIDYVGLTNRGGSDDDRVVVLIEAMMRDYVEDGDGGKVLRKGEPDDLARLCQYWTLGIRDGRWILLSIEQRAEGEHNLTDAIIASPWSDADRLRDETVIETAAAAKLPAGFKPSDVADLDFDGDARAAALDLSLADGRFAPDALEAVARRAVEAWAEAVDGDDTALAELATKPALQQLLYGDDENERTRLVVRGPRVKRIAIVALDATADPATMTLEVELEGPRYVEDRDTEAVLSGSKAEATGFTERWTLALDGPEAHPWRIGSVAGSRQRVPG